MPHKFSHQFFSAVFIASALIVALASHSALADGGMWGNYFSRGADQASATSGDSMMTSAWPANLYGRDVPPELRANAASIGSTWNTSASTTPAAGSSFAVSSTDQSKSSDGMFQLQEQQASDAAQIGDVGFTKCADPKYGMYAFFAYETFRGPSDGDWQKDGLNTGVNFGTSLGPISDWTGVGFQIGGSAGTYDIDGAGYRAFNQDVAEVQGFFTYGFFRKPDESSRWCAAVVEDWMFNTTYGVFAQNVTFSQWRTQLGYLWSDSTEVGLWGAWRGQTQSRDIPGYGPTAWRGVNELSVYWHHKWFECGPDTTIWLGVPERVRFDEKGSLGDAIAAALSTAPITDRLSFYALISYVHPSAGPGDAGLSESFWDFTIGLAYYPGANNRTPNLNGQRWMPLVPIANNGTFLIDTNRGF